MQNKDKVDNAIKQMAEKDIIPKNIKEVKGGVNSIILKIEEVNCNRAYALKFYNRENARNRQNAEIRFIKNARVNASEECPEIVMHDEVNMWTLLSWIEGKKPEKLSGDDIEQIGRFIGLTNLGLKDKDQKMELGMARDSYTSIDILIKNIHNRMVSIRRLINNQSSTERKLEIDEICNFLEIKARDAITNLKTKKNNYYWNIKSKDLIMSPSDVGIHNTIRTVNGLSFIDFEYAGYDDLSKAASDWADQPNYIYSSDERDRLIKSLKANLYWIGEEWIYRYQDTQRINKIKWCFIIMKQVILGEERTKKLDEIKEYIRKAGLNSTPD